MGKKYINTGLSLIGSSVAVGSIPNISGTSAEANVKTNFSTGISKAGKALPIMAKVTGTKMVINPLMKLKKSTKKLDLGGTKL